MENLEDMVARSKEKLPVHRVAPSEEPSAEWGWHGSFSLGTRIAGWFVAATMFLMLIGNHDGMTENLWLIGIGLVIVCVLVADRVRARTSWRR